MGGAALIAAVKCVCVCVCCTHACGEGRGGGSVCVCVLCDCVGGCGCDCVGEEGSVWVGGAALIAATKYDVVCVCGRGWVVRGGECVCGCGCGCDCVRVIAWVRECVDGAAFIAVCVCMCVCVGVCDCVGGLRG